MQQVSPAALALGAALVLAVSSRMTKRLAVTFPHRQLVAPLLLLNSLLVVPFAVWSPWRLSVTIVELHLASAVALVFSSFCIFDLFRQGSAAAVAVGQAITPVPALAFSVVLLASPSTGWQAVGDLVVSAGVIAALGPVFGELSRVRAVATMGLAAALQGLLVVLTKLLTNRGVSVGEIYVTRTALAGVLACMLVFPRDIPLRAIPPLALRSALQSAYFVLMIFAVERGSPSTVQTLVATTPLMVLTLDAVTSARRPPLRLILAAVAVVAGVALSVS
jgi:drug/metabolite transporter (DMT)-like permease